jgi:hypothetical protein
VPRVAVGECVVAPGDNGGSKQSVAVLMVGAKPLAFLGVGFKTSAKALHGSPVPTTATLVSAVPLPGGVVVKFFPPLNSGGSHAYLRR